MSAARARRQQRPERPRGTWLKLLGAVGMVVGLLATTEILLGLREQASRSPAYAPIGPGEQDADRAAQALRARIGLLLKPRDGKLVIGGDRSARLIEAGLLHGRLAILHERHGQLELARARMAEGVALLKAAAHPEPTEAHIRATLTKQDARRAR